MSSTTATTIPPETVVAEAPVAKEETMANEETADFVVEVSALPPCLYTAHAFTSRPLPFVLTCASRPPPPPRRPPRP